MEDAIRIAIMLGALILSVIIHEMAHALTALWMGDPTGKNDNRLSWNPKYHIDPFMTIVLPIITVISLGFPFGGAKPVQINPMNFKNPGKGMMLSSAAGPLSNFLLAGLALGIFYLLLQVAPNMVIGLDGKTIILTYNGYFFFYMMLINVMLGVFNLIPIPPLDGSRVLHYLLPKDGKRLLDQIEPYGLFIVIGILMMGGFGLVIYPAFVFLFDLLYDVFGPEVSAAFLATLRKG